MANTFKKHFGHMLLVLDTENPMHQLPSPNQLKHKILLKVPGFILSGTNQYSTTPTLGSHKDKTLAPYGRARVAGAGQSTTTVTRENTIRVIAKELSDQIYLKSVPFPGQFLFSFFFSFFFLFFFLFLSSLFVCLSLLLDLLLLLSQRQLCRVDPSLQPLGLQEAKDYGLPWEISSFSELTLAKQPPDDMMKYNMRQLSRVYPKGTRVDSSNFMPGIAWELGCQLVALNYQTPGEFWPSPKSTTTETPESFGHGKTADFIHSVDSS